MNFNEKIDLLNKVKKEFRNAVSLSFSELTNYLKLEDIISTDFETKLLNVFMESDRSGDKMFIKALEDNYSYRSFGSSLFERFKDDSNACKKIIDKYLDYALKTEEFNLINFSFLKGNEDYVSQKLLNEKKLLELINKNNSNDVISKIWDRTLVTSDSKTIYSLIQLLEDTNSTYTNLPLIILNQNLSSDQKVEIIKKTYKQKDQNKYIMFMRDSIVNLNDLDTFIEATIIQNNRVKEKDRGVVDILRRIFVGIRGNSSTVNFDKFQNLKEFSVKYRKYFTTSVCNTFLDADTSYYIRRNARGFLVELFKDISFEEKIKLATDVKDFGEYLFEDYKQLLDDSKGKQTEELVLNYVVKQKGINQITGKLNESEVANYINKFPSLIPYVKDIFKLDQRNSWRYSDNDDITRLVNILKKLNKNVIEDPNLSLFSNESFGYQYFGFNVDNNKSYHNNVSNFIIFNNKTLNMINTVLSAADSKDYLKEYLYNKILKTYADESFIASDMLTVLISALNNDVISEILSKSDNPKSRAADVFQEIIFKPVLFLFEKFFPDQYETVKENLNSLETNLKIIINI
jgi:hypothetical protein